MSDDKTMSSMLSGEVWAQFCDELKALGADMLRPTAPKAPVDLAKGHRFLTRMLRSAFELIVESGDAAVPALTVSLHETMKLGWDNPDNIHHNAYISEAFEYRVFVRRGDAHTVTFAIYGGSYGKSEKGRDTVAFVDLADLEVESDGRFEVRLSARDQPGNWIRLGPGATTLMIRQTFWDRRSDRPGEFRIEGTDATEPPPPLDPAMVAGALRRTTRYLRGSDKLFFDYSDRFKAAGVDRFEGSDPEGMRRNQGIPFNQMSSGWRQLADDEGRRDRFRAAARVSVPDVRALGLLGRVPRLSPSSGPYGCPSRAAPRRAARTDPFASSWPSGSPSCRGPSGSRRRAIARASGSSAGTSSLASRSVPGRGS